MELESFILAVIIGTLAAIVYSLRVLLILERRVASMEISIKRMVDKVLTIETKGKKSVMRKSKKR